jgi:hypothetical protein
MAKENEFRGFMEKMLLVSEKIVNL